MTLSNILDPIHDALSPHVWDHPDSDRPVLKEQHAAWIKRTIYAALTAEGYTDVEKWLHLVLTGSLTTYQYSEASDCDVSLFVDVKLLPEWSRAEMIGVMVDKVDGKILPGTPFPMQDFVVASGLKPSDLYKPGLRSGYDIDTGEWIVPPERDRIHDVEAEENGFYVYALQMADKMERLLKYEPDKAIRFWHQIHRRRQLDQRSGKGDFAESNIVYKFLANRGLFKDISDYSGEYIAKTGTGAIWWGGDEHCGHNNQHIDERGALMCEDCGAECHGPVPTHAPESHPDPWMDTEPGTLTLPEKWNFMTKTAGGEVAKFVYHPQSNKLVMGQMGPEEGANLTHYQLAMSHFPAAKAPELTYGQVGADGVAQSFGRSRIGPGQTPMNPYEMRYKTEEAVRRALPGSKFYREEEMRAPHWQLAGDPHVVYTGEPPMIQPTEDEPSSAWDFA